MTSIFNPAAAVKCVFKGDEKARLLESAKWFEFLKWPQLVLLAEAVDVYKIPAGTHIFEEGSKEASMGVLAEGTVNIVKSDAAGNKKTIAVLRKGSVFGEMSLIDGSPRSATAIAETEAILVLLSHEKFLQLAHDKTKLAFDILHKISSLLSQRLRLTSSKLVDALSEG